MWIRSDQMKPLNFKAMEDIAFPTKLEDLFQCDGVFTVNECWDPESLAQSEISSKIEELGDLACSGDLKKFSQSNIDDIYSLVHSLSNIPDSLKCEFLDNLIELGASSLDSIRKELDNEEKNAVKIIFYFAFALLNRDMSAKSDSGVSIAKVAKKGKSKASDGTFNWNQYQSRILDLMLAFLENESLSSIWSMGVMPENFVSMIWQPSLKQVVSRPGNMLVADKQIKALSTNVIVSCIPFFGNPETSGSYASLSAALLEAVIANEHMGSFVADICSKACKHNDLTTGEILRDIGNLNMGSMSSTGLKNLGNFMEVLAKNDAKLITRFFPVLLKQLDCNAHQIRSSLLTVMGNVIHYIHKCCVTSESDETTSTSKEESRRKSKGENLESKAVDGVKEEKNNDDEEENEDEEEEEEESDLIALQGKDGRVNTEALLRTRDSLLDILMERCHDMNHYTRSNVLRVWAYLCEESAVPVRRLGSVAEAAWDRFHDKTSTVRKQAVALLTTLMDNNPLASDLHVDKFEARRVELLVSLQTRVDDIVKATSMDENSEDPQFNEELEEQLSEKEKLEMRLRLPDVQQDSEVTAIRKNLEYVVSSMEVVQALTKASMETTRLLKSKVSSDVVEALRFLKRAVNFNVKGSADHLKSTFSLIWHQDSSIQGEVLAAFKEVFLTDGSDGSNNNSSNNLSPREVAHNLMELVQRCTEPSELTSVEKIVGELYSQQQISTEVVNQLWDIVGQHEHAFSNAGSVGRVDSRRLGQAVMVLSMVLKSPLCPAKPQGIRLLISVGFHDQVFANRDFHTLQFTCVCINRVKGRLDLNAGRSSQGPSAKKVATGTSEMEVVLNEAQMGLVGIMMGRGCDSSCSNPSMLAGDEEISRRWLGACEEACHALYHSQVCPDRIATEVVLSLWSQMSQGSQNGPSVVSPWCLSRFLYLVGQLSLCTLLYTEKLAALTKGITSNLSAPNNTTSGEDGASSSSAPSLEDEMGLSAAHDAESEKVYANVVETQIVLQNLLGRFHGVLADVIMNPQRPGMSQGLVRESAVLSLCKYMSVSMALCERYLPLLFTVLEREPRESIRTSIVMALGDLSFRFPNCVEPWTDKLYSRLSDVSESVRYNTLQVLTHLVLNDMIKVKGHIREIVMSLAVDPCQQVRDLCSVLFIRLSERTPNPIYNLLGDIISALSVMTMDDVAVGVGGEVEASQTNSTASNSSSGVNNSITMNRTLTEKDFQQTMAFLLSFVKKDKQSDGLLDRLLQRLSLSQSLRQRRNLAFCIGELTVSEKGLQRIAEMLRTIRDALYDDRVMDSIRSCLNRTKKALRFTSGANSGGNSTASNSANGTAADKGASQEDAGDMEPSSTSTAAASSGGALSSSKEAKVLLTNLEAALDRIRSCSRGESQEGEGGDSGDMDLDMDIGSMGLGKGPATNTSSSMAGEAKKTAKRSNSGNANTGNKKKKSTEGDENKANQRKAAKRSAPKKRTETYSDDDEDDEDANDVRGKNTMDIDDIDMDAFSDEEESSTSRKRPLKATNKGRAPLKEIR